MDLRCSLFRESDKLEDGHVLAELARDCLQCSDYERGVWRLVARASTHLGPAEEGESYV